MEWSDRAPLALEAAESLGAPIYLHPTQPPKPVIEASFGGFAPLVTEILAGPGFGWHIETAVHVLRMVLGGVFDCFPKLQIVIGHMGEGLPFFMQRVDVMPVELTQLKRPVSAYLRDNLHYTFAGFNFLPTFLDLLLEIGVNRIMFSASGDAPGFTLRLFGGSVPSLATRPYSWRPCWGSFSRGSR
jgi:uncharacterized protein